MKPLTTITAAILFGTVVYYVGRGIFGDGKPKQTEPSRHVQPGETINQQER
jgi:hypothetical protein